MLAALLGATTGCQFLVGLVTPSTTTVRLVNDGDFDVEATVYIDDDQNVLEDLIDDVGTQLTFTIPPGETREFTRDCNAIQAVMIDNAELRVIGAIGPETSSEVQRDGDDFNCGDIVTFTFDHSALLTDFRVNTSVTSGN